MAPKLKPARATAFWATIAIILILVGIRFLFEETGFRIAIGVLMGAMWLVHLLIVVRVRNAAYLVPLLFYLFGALTFLANDTRIGALVPYFAAAAVIAYILLLRALFTRRMKWRFRDILELAARPVEGADDGFTGRPYPAGAADYTKEQILLFARFLLKHMIAFPYVERDRVILVVPENMLPRLLGLKRSYRDSTFVSFGFDGRLSVQIAKNDYERYREELTFDELCRSFATLFGEFIELHRSGRGKLIISRLDGLEPNE